MFQRFRDEYKICIIAMENLIFDMKTYSYTADSIGLRSTINGNYEYTYEMLFFEGRLEELRGRLTFIFHKMKEHGIEVDRKIFHMSVLEELGLTDIY